MIIPPYLQPGDTIGITCPAGAVLMSEMQHMIQTLEHWGFRVKLGKTVGTQFGKFSATDAERLADVQQMLNDSSIQAILFGRGGYGVVRIIDDVDFTTFMKNPKWLLGYSDITCFHSHVQAQLSVCTIHGHMLGGYQPAQKDVLSTQSIYDALTGKPHAFHIDPHYMNRVGQSSGTLCGGNLALLSDLIGTPSDIDTRGKILLIEDIAEYKYNIDRMMWQLLRAGKLNELAGMLVGGFTDTLDNEIPFGMTAYEIVLEKVKDFTYPVCFNFPVGHQPNNVALKLGITVQLSVTDQAVTLTEHASTPI